MPLSKIDEAGLASNAQYNGFKNRIINGAMGIWQRGTSFSNPTTTNFYTADRWGVNRAGDVTGATVSRSTSAPTGFQYSLSLQRTAGNTSTAGLYLFNSNETVNTLDLAGQTVTLSFWARVGANYSGGTLNINAYGGTGIDERIYAYTGSTTLVSYAPTLTTTWTQYSTTFTVPSNITEMGSQFAWFPTGTAGADDAVYITGVQLEKGSVATAFDYRPYTTELQLCQRYYYQYAGDITLAVYRTDTGLKAMTYTYKVSMRAAPTTTITSTGGTGSFSVSSNTVDDVLFVVSGSSLTSRTWIAAFNSSIEL
jgi:hypothetical protein